MAARIWCAGLAGEFLTPRRKRLTGLYGGVFNVFGNVASIGRSLVIGYLVSELHSFNAALVFVGCSSADGDGLHYLFIS